MNTIKTIITTLISASLLFSASVTFAQPLDEKSATVRMNVAKFASITGLDDFVLLPTNVDGAAGEIYRGSDTFNIESNQGVRVILEGDPLSNGNDILNTQYDLNGDGMQFDTEADRVHNQQHTVNAQAELGDISSQLAGDYEAEIKITVSPL